MTTISPQDVQVREIQREDLPDLVNYFFRSDPKYLNSIGLKTPEPGDAENFQQMLERRFYERERGGPRIVVLAVFYRGERVGYHPTTHREEGRSLIMHAHFDKAQARGKGIGTISYVLAIEKFLTDYGYQEVIFKTPVQNLGPMKIKEKLGLKAVGEEVIDWPELVGPLKTKVFRVTREDLPALKARISQ